MKTITITLDGTASPKVEFTGDYIRRAELDLAIRAVKRAHRIALRQFRKRKIIEEYEHRRGLSGVEAPQEMQNDAGQSRS